MLIHDQLLINVGAYDLKTQKFRFNSDFITKYFWVYFLRHPFLLAVSCVRKIGSTVRSFELFETLEF